MNDDEWWDENRLTRGLRYGQGLFARKSRGVAG